MKREMWFVGGLSAFLASLACLPPVLLVILGVSSASFAAAFGNAFYNKYWWVFILLGIFLMGVVIYFSLRKKGICTLGDIKNNREKVAHIFIYALLFFFIAYLIFEIFWEIIWIRLGIYGR